MSHFCKPCIKNEYQCLIIDSKEVFGTYDEHKARVFDMVSHMKQYEIMQC